MSTIGTTNSAAGDALTSLLRSSSAAGAYRTSPQSSETSTSAKRGDGPAVVVDVSDRAKALYERTKVAQAVADKLEQQVAAAKGDGKQPLAPKPKSDSSGLFDIIAGGAAQGATQMKWEAGAPYGDPTKSDAEFIKSNSLDTSLQALADHFDKQGFPPETGQALRDAVNNGTLKFQKASEIPELNFHSEQTFTPSAVGGGYDGSGTTRQNPTGATKEALDNGKALAMWTADRGDIYITW